MQIIEIEAVFASGLKIVDCATVDDSLHLDVSDRLLQLLREMDKTEALPVITATVNGQAVTIRRRGELLELGGDLPVQAQELPASACARLLEPFLAPTKDQRQQVGRFLHTLSAASLAGAVGFWHSTSAWTTGAVLNELGLAIAFVITFYQGMVSMKGE